MWKFSLNKKKSESELFYKNTQSRDLIPTLSIQHCTPNIPFPFPGDNVEPALSLLAKKFQISTWVKSYFK